MEILILQDLRKLCRLCLKEDAQDLSELSQEIQDLFFELTQTKVN